MPSGSKNGMFGKKHSPETIEKIRQAHLGKKLSEEHKKKVGLAGIGRTPWNRGKSHTPETVEKMKLANTGNNNGMYGKRHSPESIEKMRQAKLGKKHTKEHNEKIGISGKGIKPSEETRLKMSLWQRGEGHWNWQGGKTTKNAQERKYFSTVIGPKVFARDNYTCQICDEYCGDLHADHIKSWAKYPELRFEIDNCRTLCRPCHYYVTLKKKMPPGSRWGIKRHAVYPK